MLLVSLLALALFLALAALSPVPSALFRANLAAVQQSKAELSVYSFPAYGLQDEVRRELDLSAPIANYQQALTTLPDHPGANRRLGQIHLSLGDYEEARRLLERAYAAMPWDNATRQLLGEAHIATGHFEEGVALWATANNAQNQLRAREAWYQLIGDEERLAAVRSAIQQATVR